MIRSPAMMLLAEQADDHSTKNPARVYATLDAARMTGMLAGPVVGGVAVGSVGFAATMALDAMSSIVLVVSMAALGLRRFPPEHPATGRPGWWRHVVEAPALLAANRVVRAAMGALAAAIVFTAVFTVAEVFYVRATLSATPLEYGLVTTAFVAGRLLASVWPAPKIAPQHQRRTLVAAGLLMGAGLAGAGLSGSLLGAAIGFAAAGVANSLQVSAITVLIATHVPPAVKGRAFAAMGSVNNAATMLGTLLGAPAVAAVGAGGALVVAGAGTAAATAAAAPVLLVRGREQPEDGVDRTPSTPRPGRAGGPRNGAPPPNSSAVSASGQAGVDLHDDLVGGHLLHRDVETFGGAGLAHRHGHLLTGDLQRDEVAVDGHQLRVDAQDTHLGVDPAGEGDGAAADIAVGGGARSLGGAGGTERDEQGEQGQGDQPARTHCASVEGIRTFRTPPGGTPPDVG